MKYKYDFKRFLSGGIRILNDKKSYYLKAEKL